MITEQEERVIILLKAAMEIGAKYHECHFCERIAINDILIRSEVSLHPEAVEELVEWLRNSEL